MKSNSKVVFKNYSPTQILLLPPSLEEMIEAHHPVRVVNEVIDRCHALRDYIKTKRITTVAMESTGVFWVVLYAVLEEAGIDVYLVNGRDVKNVPGRKSDVKDCQ